MFVLEEKIEKASSKVPTRKNLYLFSLFKFSFRSLYKFILKQHVFSHANGKTKMHGVIIVVVLFETFTGFCAITQTTTVLGSFYFFKSIFIVHH